MKYSAKYLVLFLVSINFSSCASMNASEFLKYIKKMDIMSSLPIYLILQKNALSNNETVLHTACSQGDYDIVTQIFFREDINPYTALFLKDGNGDLSLHKAAENNQINIINFLLDMNDKHNSQPPLLIFHKNHSNGGTALHHAIRNGNLETVEILLEYTKKYNYVESLLFKEVLGNLTSLHLSVLCGFHAITKTLLVHAGKYSYLLAATYTNPIFNDEITPIHEAIKKEDSKMLSTFIDTLGMDVLKIQNKKGITALEYAKACDSEAIHSVLTMYGIT